jgi:hypothetical protein
LFFEDVKRLLQPKPLYFLVFEVIEPLDIDDDL